jgi:hypothetical protein
MAGARIGSGPHAVGGPESCQRGSIQFAFRARQKENVMRRQTEKQFGLKLLRGFVQF